PSRRKRGFHIFYHDGPVAKPPPAARPAADQWLGRTRARNPGKSASGRAALSSGDSLPEAQPYTRHLKLARQAAKKDECWPANSDYLAIASNSGAVSACIVSVVRFPAAASATSKRNASL